MGANNTSTLRYYLGDNIGSTSLLINSDGTICSESDYLPYGKEQVVTAPCTATENYKYTGKERDSESGLDYFGARYYGATMGRWLSPDWGEKPMAIPYAQYDDPQSLNLYGYVRNNPITGIDADGHCWVTFVCDYFNEVKEDVKETLHDIKNSVKSQMNSAIRTARKLPMQAAKVVTSNPDFDPHNITVDDVGNAFTNVVIIAVTEGAAEPAIAAEVETSEVAEFSGGRPTEAYNRVKHYGRTPTAGDRAAVGGESVDHDPPLVQRYYEGDAANGEKPGYQQTSEERRASASDRSRMKQSTKQQQSSQGGKMKKYSTQKKKEHELL